METVTRKTATNLTSESVSILTQQFERDKNGEEIQVGANHRCAYENSESGRALLIANEPEEIVATVLQMWGDEPTIEEPEILDYTPEPTAEEKIAELEAKVASQAEEINLLNDTILEVLMA